MKRIVCFILSAFVLTYTTAQPPKTRTDRGNAGTAGSRARGTTQAATNTDRASLMFPTSVDMPDDVVWRRDLYRTIDLTKKENAALYYPVEPIDGRANLFTTIFRLLNTGKLPAYNYKLDGLEHFDKDNRMHFKDMLDKYDIFYEVNGNSIQVENADIPSAEVTTYWIKESSYYDQYTATYHTKVVAICPVLNRSDDFSMDARPYPLFWVKYEDLEPFLNNMIVMTSDINNASTMSAADFFGSNHYKGDIYMTTNMQNKSLEQYCETDSDLVKEQKKIEQEMVNFEQRIWKEEEKADTSATDSVDADTKDAKKARAGRRARGGRRGNATKVSSSKERRSRPASSGGSSSGRISVRRERHYM